MSRASGSGAPEPAKPPRSVTGLVSRKAALTALPGIDSTLGR
jgi:hypothetical protein